MLRAVAPDARSGTRSGRFAEVAETVAGGSLPDYRALWRWSITNPDQFWALIAAELGVRWHDLPSCYLADRRMPGARWCPGGSLNYAEHALGFDGSATAVISRSQTREERQLSRDQMRAQVARCAAGLRALGIRRGDRVAGYLPNIEETLIAFLACASIGAVWACAPPEFGLRSALDRLRQFQPSVLIAADGYRYGVKAIDRRSVVAELLESLPSVRHLVQVPYLHDHAQRALTWGDLLTEDAPLTFEPVPFEHPLYVLFSSGTTGLPKPIVHGHGGIVLEHLKSHALHFDLGEQDRFYWFSTTGWMMWNFLVSGLLVGASVVLFDGDPSHPDLGETWRIAAQTGITALGTSAPFLQGCRRAEIVPRRIADLRALRVLGSTGAPLSADGFRWVYEAVADGDLLLTSICGGTDVCTAFIGGSPLLAVRAGEISGPWLGADVRAADAHGRGLVEEMGELVLALPLPSMPVGLLGDEDGSRLRAAYFERFPGMWHHGDWLLVHQDDAMEVSGRSDATLNRGGVRLGTAELYSVVEDLDGVLDSLVIHLEDAEGGAGELIMFVVPEQGVPEGEPARIALCEEVAARCATALRRELSPRHVPDTLHLVPSIPRTLSGKKLEIPVKRILTGTPIEQVAARETLQDPAALDAYLAFAPPS